MSRRVVAAVAVALFGFSPFAANAAAQERARTPVVNGTAEFVNSLGTTIRLTDINLEATAQQLPVASDIAPQRRRGVSPTMASLYASTAVLQALDVHSTLRGLDRSAMEANPLMSGLTKNKFAFIGVKAAVAIGTIYAGREMAKKNKVAAIITLVAINAVYGYVAHNNYKVARGIGR